MLIAGESGKLLRIGAGVDLSAAEEIELTIRPPDGSEAVTRTKSGGHITVSGSEVTVEIEQRDGVLRRRTFAPWHHVEYWSQLSDFPIPGEYSLRLTATLPGGKLYRSRVYLQRVFA